MAETFHYSPYLAESDADPFPLYQRLRDEFPAYWCEEANMWFITRYDDVSAFVQDWETFSSREGNLLDELPGRTGSTLGSTDPPRHDRLRALIQSAFTRKAVSQLEDEMRELGARLAKDCHAAGEFDFVNEFSSQITVNGLFSLMGLPKEDHRAVRKDVVLMVQTDSETHRKAQRHLDAFARTVDYVKTQIAERQQNPGEDLISRLITAEIDGDKLTESEVVMTSATLIMAGVESLSSFLAMLAMNLAENPAERAKVNADMDKLPKAIEESMRLNTSAQRFARVLTRDLELHGQHLKKGDKVALCYGAANRDERKFADPDTYNIDRDTRGHLGLGGGKHLCLGNVLARMICKVVMEEFLQEMPDFELAVDHGDIQWNPSSNFRAPTALPLRAL